MCPRGHGSGSLGRCYISQPPCSNILESVLLSSPLSSSFCPRAVQILKGKDLYLSVYCCISSIWNSACQYIFCGKNWLCGEHLFLSTHWVLALS